MYTVTNIFISDKQQNAPAGTPAASVTAYEEEQEDSEELDNASGDDETDGEGEMYLEEINDGWDDDRADDDAEVVEAAAEAAKVRKRKK